MTEQQIKYFLSQSRINVYLAHTGNDFEKAFNLYKANIEHTASEHLETGFTIMNRFFVICKKSKSNILTC